MCTGVTAALELALVSKDLTNMEKLDFVRRKVEFMQEFGDVGRYVIILHKSNRIFFSRFYWQNFSSWFPFHTSLGWFPHHFK